MGPGARGLRGPGRAAGARGSGGEARDERARQPRGPRFPGAWRHPAEARRTPASSALAPNGKGWSSPQRPNPGSRSEGGDAHLTTPKPIPGFPSSPLCTNKDTMSRSRKHVGQAVTPFPLSPQRKSALSRKAGYPTGERLVLTFDAERSARCRRRGESEWRVGRGRGVPRKSCGGIFGLSPCFQKVAGWL